MALIEFMIDDDRCRWQRSRRSAHSRQHVEKFPSSDRNNLVWKSLTKFFKLQRQIVSCFLIRGRVFFFLYNHLCDWLVSLHGFQTVSYLWLTLIWIQFRFCNPTLFKMGRVIRKTDPLKKAGRKDGFNRSGHRFIFSLRIIYNIFYWLNFLTVWIQTEKPPLWRE